MKKIISGIILAGIIASTAMISPAVVAAEAPVLKADSKLVLAKDGASVFGTGGEITAEELAAEFDGTVSIKAPNGTALEGKSVVPTGSTASNDAGSVSVLVVGDSNIDGKINVGDVIAILKKIAKNNVTIDETASDIDASGKMNTADAIALLKHIAKWDVKLGNMKVVYDEKPLTAKNEDKSTILWTDHGTTKHEQSNFTDSGNYTYIINAAKNEAEGATVYISPDETKRGITVSATEFVNSYGDTVDTEVFTMYYTQMKVNDTEKNISADYGYMPDALMPTNSTYEAYIEGGKSQGFYLEGTTDENTFPGLYESTVSIKENGVEIKRAKIYLNVWDLTLLDEDAPRSSFGLDKLSISNAHFVNNEDDVNALYKKYYDFLLNDRMCAFVLPYNPETDEADVYLNDPRVNSFVVYGLGYGGIMNTTIEQLQERYEKLSANDDWFEKAYFYCADEPYDTKVDENKNPATGYQTMKDTKALIDEYFPGGKQVVPLETGTHITLYDGFMEMYRETTDILCPKTYAFVPTKYYGTSLVGNGYMNGKNVWEMHQAEIVNEWGGSYAAFADDCLAKDENKESWWYYAGLPGEPLTTYHASADGMYVRMGGFQMYQEDVTGVLYYATTEWQGAYYNNLYYGTGVGVAAFGNGILVYPGARMGVDGPIGSIRCDYIRDSFEDYMMLKLAERTIGKEATDELVLKVTRDLVDFETDAAKMQAVRSEIAEAIMAAEAAN